MYVSWFSCAERGLVLSSPSYECKINLLSSKLSSELTCNSADSSTPEHIQAHVSCSETAASRERGSTDPVEQAQRPLRRAEARVTGDPVRVQLFHRGDPVFEPFVFLHLFGHCGNGALAQCSDGRSAEAAGSEGW